MVLRGGLNALVPPGQRFGYDLIASVGISRYIHGQQREEIRQALLIEHGIEVSTGSVTTLCDRFLNYFEALHIHRAPELRAALGEYPLHIDATCEKGKGGLFVCMSGFKGWVLGAARIGSEEAEQLRPVIERTVELFGKPIAVVRDMGKGGALAVKELRTQGVVDLICHFHFLAALGGRLFDSGHSLLRKVLDGLELRSDLRNLLKELTRYTGDSSSDGRWGQGRVRDGLRALVKWVLDRNDRKAPLYPFSLPHLDFINRCRQVPAKADFWLARPRTQVEHRAFAHLLTLVGHLERDPRIAATAKTLEARFQLFDELREVLRLSNPELTRGEIRTNNVSIPALEFERLREIKAELERFESRLRTQLPPEERERKRPRRGEAIILQALDRHGARLFGHPARRDSDGTIIAVVERTNNIPEHFFGQQKRGLRRRLGRKQLRRDLEQQPAQVALVANLNHSDYVRVLCGSIKALPKAFATLAQSGLVDSTPLRERSDLALKRRIQTLLELESAPAQQSIRAAVPSRPTEKSQVADDNTLGLPAGSVGKEHTESVSNPVTDESPLARQDDSTCSRAAGDEDLRARTKLLFQAPAPPPKPRDPRLPPPGTILRCGYKQRNHCIHVREDGFVYRGEQYGSLTAVTRAITGQAQNAFAFVGLVGDWDPAAYAARSMRLNRRRRRLATES